MAKRILLVEDEAIIALAERRVLEDAGYAVTVAHSGEKAVAAVTGAGEDPFDLVLMDIDLGTGIDGTEAARRILEGQDIPVVFLSSHTEPEIVARTEEITSYGYILKNSGATVLLASIRMAFQLFDAHRQLEEANQETRRHTDYLRTILDSAPMGFLVVDDDGHVQDVNRAYCVSTGYEPAELIGTHISDRDCDDDRRAVAKRMAEIREQGSQSFTTLHWRRDGSSVALEMNAQLIDTPRGRKFVALSRDLTEERRLAAEIATTERRYERIMNSMQDIVFTLDRNRRHTGVYGHWVEQFGLEREHFLGKTVSEILGSEAASAHDSHFDSALAGAFEVYEWSVPTGEQRRYYQTSLSPVFDENGEVVEIVGIGRDISDLKRAQESVSAKERLQDRLFDQVPGAIYQYRYYPDGSSRFPLASRNTEMVYEVTPEEVREDATPVFERLHPDDFDAVVASILESRDNLTDWEQDYRVVLPKRGLRWLRGRAKPERLEDGSVLWHGYITDITSFKDAYRTLEEQSGRYQGVIEGTNVGTWEWNVQTGETVFNERWAQIIGYTLEELRPTTIETWMSFAHPEDLEASKRALEAHFSGEAEFYECRARMRHRDGHWVWVLDRGKVFSWTKTGEPEWMFGTHQEISDTVEYQERLRESEANLRAFFDTSRDFLWVLDRDGRIVEVNRTVVDRLGYSREELIGTEVVALHPGDRRGEAAENFARILEGARDSCPVPLLARDGSQIPVETTVTPALWSGRDVIFGVGRDISDIALSEEKYSKMANSSPAIIGLSDSETGEFVEVNDAFCRVLGFRREEVLGQSSLDLGIIDPETREAYSRELEAAEVFSDLEATLRGADGREVEAMLYGARLHLQNRMLNLVTAIDIRARKRMEEELRAALEAKQTLMAELNHRVKNNLAMVASLIRMRRGEGSSTADLSDLESRIQTIASMHQELQESAELDKVALGPYIRRVVDGAMRSTSKEVDLELEVGEESVSTKLATPLGLILNELATNAAKHGFVDGERGRFSVTHRTGADGLHTLIVSNSGRSFPESQTLDNPGTMGLQLISALVEQIGGTIELSRSPETTFTISYPAGR